MTQPLLRKLRAWQMEVIKSESIMLTVKFIRLLYYVVGAMFPRKQSTWMRRASSLALLVINRRSLSANNAASILLFGHLDINMIILSVVLFAGGCAVIFSSTAVVCDEPIGDSKPPEVGDQAGRSCVASQGSRERDISAPGSTSKPCSDPAYLSLQLVQVPADSIGSRAAEKSLISCSVSSEEVAATTSSITRGAQLFSGEFLVGATDKGWLSCRSWEIREPIFKLNSTSIPRIPCDPLGCFTHDRLLRAVYQVGVNKSRCSSWDDSSAVLPSIHRSFSAQAQHAGGAGSRILGFSSGDTMHHYFSGRPRQDLLDVPGRFSGRPRQDLLDVPGRFSGRPRQDLLDVPGRFSGRPRQDLLDVPGRFSGRPRQDLLDVPGREEDPMEYTMSSPTAASGHCPNRPLPAPATFFIDSGATNHMTGNKALFRNYQDDSEIKEISVADGRARRVLGVGFVTSAGINLPRVLHVDGMTPDILLSVSRLTRDHDLRVVFEPEYVTVKELRSERTVGQGYVKDGMYLLDRLSLQE